MYSRAVQRVNNIKIAQNIGREKRSFAVFPQVQTEVSLSCPSAVLINYYTFFFRSRSASGKGEHSRRVTRRNGTRYCENSNHNFELKFIIENCLINLANRDSFDVNDGILFYIYMYIYFWIVFLKNSNRYRLLRNSILMKN